MNRLKLLIPIFALIAAQLACFPPQDCMGVSFQVIGQVVDSAGQPIAHAEINAYNDGSYEKPPFNVTTISGVDGHFETESVSSFACTPFTVQISAHGFQTQQFTYYPPGEEWPDSLPSQITVVLMPSDE